MGESSHHKLRLIARAKVTFACQCQMSREERLRLCYFENFYPLLVSRNGRRAKYSMGRKFYLPSSQEHTLRQEETAIRNRGNLFFFFDKEKSRANQEKMKIGTKQNLCRSVEISGSTTQALWCHPCCGVIARVLGPDRQKSAP